MKLNDTEKMFDCLEKSAEHAIRYDSMKEGKYTSFIVNRIDYSPKDAVKDHTENQSGLLLKSLRDKKFKQYEKDSRMEKIVGMLTSAAIL